MVNIIEKTKRVKSRIKKSDIKTIVGEKMLNKLSEWWKNETQTDKKIEYKI